MHGFLWDSVYISNCVNSYSKTLLLLFVNSIGLLLWLLSCEAGEFQKFWLWWMETAVHDMDSRQKVPHHRFLPSSRQARRRHVATRAVCRRHDGFKYVTQVFSLILRLLCVITLTVFCEVANASWSLAGLLTQLHCFSWKFRKSWSRYTNSRSGHSLEMWTVCGVFALIRDRII